ncbi:hypothetical protein C8Q76DRAFT_266766 [Earliella scabrosa]|nr:hypothetical protein C8Q76DRAFT_266766 [Earliella scabrosa]
MRKYKTRSSSRLCDPFDTSTLMTRLNPRQDQAPGGTNVTCLQEYNWMDNSIGQNPCLIASWAIVPCPPSVWAIRVLNPNMPYDGPGPGSPAAPCYCNTVFYSLLSACATCQGYFGEDGINNYTQHTANCPRDLLDRGYHRDIPRGTVFPEWAYLPLRNDRWDENAASVLALQNMPESASATASASTSTSASTSPEPSPTGDAAPTARSTSVVGPAVGGAVGGLAALLIGIAMLCLRRRRTKVTSRNQVAVGGVLVPTESYYGHHAKTTIYDPDDPRTFPPPRSPPTTTSDYDNSLTLSDPRSTGRQVAEIQ